MSNEKSQKIMEKIALLLQEEEKGSDDSAFLRENFAKINQRLDKIEAQFAQSNPKSQIPSPKSLHPSLEKLRIVEEIVEELFANQQTEKACILETNKPCDNCSMCNSRGF
ncbi:MAG TPA: hypothetical protein PKY82_19985 [Pyrinomonadaceae bacterium]|nr:hypothetical protein [Pyrinomonadaceae bacterium]